MACLAGEKGINRFKSRLCVNFGLVFGGLGRVVVVQKRSVLCSVRGA